MAKEPLVMRIYFEAVYTDLARAVNYLGYPARSLADHVRPLTQKYGVKKVSEALIALCTFEGNRVMLNREARPRCGQLLGPPPERQLDYWQDVKTECRQKGWDDVPEIPKGGSDPLMEGLYRLGPADLNVRFCQARRKVQHRGKDEDRVEMIAVESEMLRRGMDLSKGVEEDESKLEAAPERTKVNGRITPEAAAENVRGSVPQRVTNILLDARRGLATGGPDSATQRIWADASEAELKRQGVEIPAEEATPPKKRTKKVTPPREEGLSPETYAATAKSKNKRSLFCMLRDARKQLTHNGKSSFSGREAKKAITAIEKEISNRGYSVPIEGQETAEWERASTVK